MLLMITNVTQDVGILLEAYHTIITQDLQMSHVIAKPMSCLLTVELKDNHMLLALTFIGELETIQISCSR